ncbi:hypothetical protein Desti_5340 [Desulfomonile tiedjei DSM 6799]|uniref:Uncharacterized protein n=1 Tax=Desulfomonile tiedjei (strain ATCC 49306 / DSM 6799 / DCB-1) TaxID=706587 RepID=I4CED8_DESTA|nr:hypothetical protein Desti_5340 [Desulfomonile tiedjei DSM 6799]
MEDPEDVKRRLRVILRNHDGKRRAVFVEPNQNI